MAMHSAHEPFSLQCCDTVGWAEGRTSGLKHGVVLLVVIWLELCPT